MLESLALSGHVTVSCATSLVWNSTAWGSGIPACKLLAARSLRVIGAGGWVGKGDLWWPGFGTAAVLSCCTCGGSMAAGSRTPVTGACSGSHVLRNCPSQDARCHGRNGGRDAPWIHRAWLY